MPVFRLCCCCCRLQTGGVVLGYIESFISLILLIVGIVVVAKVDSVTEALNELMSQNATAKQREELHIDPKSFKIDVIVFIVFTAVCLLVSIALIIGATKRNHKLILPYLGVKLLYFVYSIYEFIVIMINDADKVLTTIQFLIFFGLSVYLWLCVFSLFQELREHRSAPREAYSMHQQPYNPQVYKPSTIPN